MGNIQKVVIDTNVIISAFGWGGKLFQIMELLERGAMKKRNINIIDPTL